MRKKLLRKSQAEMAHVTRVMTMGELAASIAHEINQPLSAIVNNGGACLRWLAGDSPNLAEAREAAQDIIREGNRAGEVITRIRAFLRKSETEKAPIDINQTIRDVVILMRNEADGKGVALHMELADDLPAILGDRVQLQQVILNLVMNGIEAMTSLADRARELRIRSSKHESDRVLVAVQDSGIGIDGQNLEDIFDAFYTTKPQGMGMGLAISRSIVEDHGGQLWALSERRSRHNLSVYSLEAPIRLIMSEPKAMVFIVDDDEPVRTSLGRLIRSAGLKVETFDSAQRFLASPRADVPSCLVLDVKLPGLSGLELQGRLAEINIEIPIVFITGHGDVPTSVRAMKAGAVEFLTKPFRDEDLLDAIHQAIERDRVARGRHAELAEVRGRYESLTPREREVMKLVVCRAA